ncbi:MAG TPA: hypothetical protein VG269_18415 [Tepidisphaeraceae bacterium]|jgi:hypothetical protein|nr:hypothetical protein [Tepidisphaeraceae bacterium]
MLSDANQKYIRGLSDDELAEYVQAGVEMYEPEAVEFARGEFERRNLSPELVVQKTEVAKVRLAGAKAAEREVASQPLDRDSRLLAFALGWTILTPIWLFKWLGMQHRGEYQKSRDLLRFGFAGMGAFFVLIGIAMLFPRDPLSGSVAIVIGSTLLALLLIAPWLKSRRIRNQIRNRIASSQCPACGYDLTGNESGVCPECGRAQHVPA